MVILGLIILFTLIVLYVFLYFCNFIGHINHDFKKVTFFIFCFLCISSIGHSEPLAIMGTIEFSTNTYRDNVYNFIISKSTNFWNGYSNVSKQNYVKIGTNTVHNDITFDLRIKTISEQKNIENYIKTIKSDNRIIRMYLKTHICNNDKQIPCIEKEIIWK